MVVSMNQVGGPLFHVRDMSESEKRRLRKRHAEGKMVRLAPGVYMETGKFRALSRENRRLAWTVAHAARSPRSVVVGRTAAQLHDMPLAGGGPRPQVELAGTSRGRQGRAKGVLYRPLTPGSSDRVFNYLTPFGTVQATDPLQTGLDLARWHRLEDAVVALDHALHHNWFGQEQLAARLRQCGGAWGIDRIRQAGALATPCSESPRESELKMLLWRIGLPAPLQQVTIFDANGEAIARLDFFYEDIALGVEYDGGGKYTGRYHESPETVALREMEQDRRLLQQGIVLVRINAESFRDGSGLRQVTEMHGHLTRRGYTAPGLRWTAGGRAWRASGR